MQTDTPPPNLVATPAEIRARLSQLSAEARALRKALRAAEALERLRQQGKGVSHAS